MKLSTRISTAEDGRLLMCLMQESELWHQDMDFSTAAGFWLIVEDREGPAGCIQTLISKPDGALNNLCLAKRLSDHGRGLVTRKLLIDGMAVLHANFGVSHVGGFVSFKTKGYKRVLKKRGGVPIDQGNYFMRRVS